MSREAAPLAVSTESAPPARVSPLPLADLLAVLRSRGLPLGVREHLTVGRLLSRWDDPDVATLRAALAAILARNPQEVALVRETFDQLYAPPPPPEPGVRPPRPIQPLVVRGRRWVAWAAAAVLLLAALAFGGSLLWSHRHPAQPLEVPPGPVSTDAGSRPPPPTIADTHKVVNPGRRLAGAGIAAALVFLWLYGVRTGRQAGRRGRRRLSAELDALPGPQGYDLVLRDLAPPFRADLLDDVASVLGRRASDTPGGRELDVDRTLKRTLDAGLAPSIVLRARASTLPILVLEDMGDEMRPHRRAIAALLAGLEARGVHLDRWRFDEDADRLFRAPDGAALALRQLMRRRAESSLLVISTGQGILEGDERRVATWVPALRYWKQRTWLHPVADPRTWRPALAEAPLDVWPMTRPGLLAAARQIARGDTRLLGLREARALPDRAVTPLDVDRLRWLLSLAPRRDPELAELLRQRFCPAVPAAAIEEALAAPPLSTRPPLGLDDATVHAFLIGVLDDSRPDPGSAGHARWRLDRALQALGVPGQEVESELADLVASPLAPEVERALRKRANTLPTKTAQPLTARVLRPLGRRAREAGLAVEGDRLGVRRWTWPTAGELAAALVGAAVLWFGLPFVGPLANDTEPLKLRQVYRMNWYQNSNDLRSAMLMVARRGEGPGKVDLYQGDKLFQRDLAMLRPVVLRGPDRGHWYYVRARSGRDDLAISNSIWVEPSRPEPTPVVPVVPPSTEPSKAPTLAPSPGREKSWLRVTALDEAGRALPNARYTVSGPRGISYHSTTGDKPLQLTLGSWTLQVTQPGYQPVSRRISLRPGKVDYFTPVVVRLTLGAKPVEPKAIDGPSLLLPTPAPPPAEPKQETAAPPQQQQQQQYEPPAGSLVERAGETVRVHLACGEERSQELSYPLQAGESYVSATVRMGKSSNMGATVPKAVYDPETRKVSATIPLRGPKSNCEKGVDLDFHLAVTVRIAPKTKA